MFAALDLNGFTIGRQVLLTARKGETIRHVLKQWFWSTISHRLISLTFGFINLGIKTEAMKCSHSHPNVLYLIIRSISMLCGCVLSKVLAFGQGIYKRT